MQHTITIMKLPGNINHTKDNMSYFLKAGSNAVIVFITIERGLFCQGVKYILLTPLFQQTNIFYFSPFPKRGIQWLFWGSRNCFSKWYYNHWLKQSRKGLFSIFFKDCFKYFCDFLGTFLVFISADNFDRYFRPTRQIYWVILFSRAFRFELLAAPGLGYETVLSCLTNQEGKSILNA